ncbi:CIC11C00000002373 [Sungouiella intermedia]|uniref:CIC11C00000002373 n=1 Tax=Sungouiella intermedia TaxID=45354 RepID=A0A1L0BP07_9ASCO|nr:CIC11C00000002373 [[Candida] intermedia]
MGLDLYEILEIDSSSSSGDIKRAYRKLALRYHPDKVSEEERGEAEIKFKEISHAYEILIDDTKRLEYDLYGTTDGMGNGMGPGLAGFDANPFGNGFGYQEYGADDFSNFFSLYNSGAPPGARSNTVNRTPDAELEVNVTLEELYVGKVVKITSTRNVICHTCQGTGARKKAAVKECTMCSGKGYTTKIKRVGPGLVSQFHVDCSTCKGTGKMMRSKDKCKHCGGEKVVEETKILEFEILPGSKSGESVVLKGESDEFPGKQTGDVILTFHCKDHEKIVRKGDDLYIKYRISLVDALSGFSKVVMKHLDGRAIHVTTPKGKVVRPGDYLKIKGEGMPIKGSTGWFSSTQKRGDLYIEMDIEFPPDNWYLEKNDLVKLKNLLPTELKEKSKQEILGDSLPEANIEYVTDFTIAREEALPDYNPPREDDKSYANFSEHYGDHPPEYTPECTTQ